MASSRQASVTSALEKVLFVMRRRWWIAILITAAIAISYLDRQTLPVAVDAIRKDIAISNTEFSRLHIAFLVAYALTYAGGVVGNRDRINVTVTVQGAYVPR